MIIKFLFLSLDIDAHKLKGSRKEKLKINLIKREVPLYVHFWSWQGYPHQALVSFRRGFWVEGDPLLAGPIRTGPCHQAWTMTLWEETDPQTELEATSATTWTTQKLIFPASLVVRYVPSYPKTNNIKKKKQLNSIIWINSKMNSVYFTNPITKCSVKKWYKFLNNVFQTPN